MSKFSVQALVVMSIYLSPIYAAGPSTSDYVDYLQATYHQRQGNVAQAEKCYQHVLQKNTSLYPYQGYLKHLFTTNQHATIVQMLPSIKQFFKDDLDAQLMFAQSLEATGHVREAEDLFIALGAQHPAHQEAAYYAAAALARRGAYQEALKVVSNYLDSATKRTVNFLFYFLQAQSYQQLKQYDKALASIKTCMSMAPEFYQGWLFFGIMNEMAGNIQEAIAGYQNYLTIVGNDQAVYQQMMLLMLNQQTATSTIDKRYALQHAVSLYQQKQYEPALTIIDEYLTSNPDDVQARLLKIDTLCALTRTFHAIELIKKWIIAQPNDDIWFKTLHTLHEADKNRAHIITTLTDLAAVLRTNPLPHLYAADIYLRSSTPHKARTHLEQALLVIKDPEVKTATLYQLALLLYEKKEYTQMKKYLEQARALGLRYSPVLNLYAYYNATKGNDLAFAQKLYDSIVDEDKQNPHIMHTQAVIWYKQRDHARAQTLLTTLLTMLPHDYSFQKYYAKNLYKLGKYELAITTLTKALASAPYGNETQKDTQLLQSWYKKI